MIKYFWYDMPTTVYWWNEFSQLVPFLLWGLLWDWLLICILLFSSLSYHCSIGLHRLFWYVGMACSIGTSVWLAVFHDVFYNVACWWCFVMWNCTCLAKLSNFIITFMLYYFPTIIFNFINKFFLYNCSNSG